LGGLIDKAEVFCGQNGIAPAAIIEARLASDRRPFAYQVKSVTVHSLGAINGVRMSDFSPDHSALPKDLVTLRRRIGETLVGLSALDAAEMDACMGRPVRFVDDDHPMDFIAEEFLFSFSQPNFYFHAATAYDILRCPGVPL
jgi:uncharacterized protein